MTLTTLPVAGYQPAAPHRPSLTLAESTLTNHAIARPPLRGPQRSRSGARSDSEVPSAAPLAVTIELTLPLVGASLGLLETLDALRQTIHAGTGGTLRLRHLGPEGVPELRQAPPSAVAGHDAAASQDQHAVRLYPDERSVWVGSREVNLTRVEFDLLLFLADHPRRVFSRRQLLGSVWGYTQARGRTVDVHVRRLRLKLREAGPLLATVRGIGYRLDNDARIAVVRPETAA